MKAWLAFLFFAVFGTCLLAAEGADYPSETASEEPPAATVEAADPYASEAAERALEKLGSLPILKNGRIKPLDTVARTTMLFLADKQEVHYSPEIIEVGFFDRIRARFGGPPVPEKSEAIRVAADVFFNFEAFRDKRVFRIQNLQVMQMIGYEGEAEVGNFSFNHIIEHLDQIEAQARAAGEIDALLRTPFQQKVLRLYEQVVLVRSLMYSLQVPATGNLEHDYGLYFQAAAAFRKAPEGSSMPESVEQVMRGFLQRFMAMSQYAELYAIAPAIKGASPHEWLKTGDALIAAFELSEPAEGLLHYARISDAWRVADFVAMEAALDAYLEWLGEYHPEAVEKAEMEQSFFQARYFERGMAYYIMALLLALVSWLIWPKWMTRIAIVLIIYGFFLHSTGLITRMVLEGRPPVTNLYSSAIFVGWAAVLLAIILECFYRNGIGTATGALVGFVTLIIAHHLSLDGDTLEMMRAVLDSNFWLATHVVVITIGYSATFLAGALGLFYLIRDLLPRGLSKEEKQGLARMVYGILCLATLFSFVGTVLGGIWADQSWGRFWGWDPKENGALIIVLWNAVVLHARWGALVKQTGLMVMAVFGNIVTAWSWFGVNMLGVGLHSYGFMDSASKWLLYFVLSQLFVMCLPLPRTLLRSLKDGAGEKKAS